MPRQRAKGSRTVPVGLKYGQVATPPELAPLRAEKHKAPQRVILQPITLPWEPTETALTCFVMHDVLSIQDVCALRAWLEHCGHWEEALLGAVVDAQVCNSLRVMWDEPRLTENLWGRVLRFMPPELRGGSLLGFNQRLRFRKFLRTS